MTTLQNKVIIVTGGASGIGGAISIVLAKRGALVIAVDINEEAGKRIVKEHPDQIRFFKGDVSDPMVAEAAVSMAVSKFGRLTGLVNNAHASRQKPLLELTQEDWDLSFGTGLNATLQFMKAAHPQMVKSGGAIVNFGSGAAMKGQKNQASYAAAKEAIRGLSRVAASEWAVDNIRVNVVSPIALTSGVEHWKENFPEQYKEVVADIPMNRFGDPQKDIAPVVAFLLSDDSQYITGQTLMADGGSIKH